jgi:type IV pilus assembly protein PilB
MLRFFQKKFTDILIEKGIITKSQLEEMIKKAKEISAPLEEVLINLNLVDKFTLLSTKAEMYHTRYVDITSCIHYEEYAKLLPETLCRRYKLICITRKDKKLSLVMANPLDVFAIDDVRIITGYEIEPLLGYAPDIDTAIDHVFGYQTLRKIAEEVSKDKVIVKEQEEISKKEEPIIIDTPLIKLVDEIIIQAVEKKASDIHIETFENTVKVRYRIDGIMHWIMNLSKTLQPPIISRIKIMAGLDIAERRLPQDGRIKMIINNRPVDLRVSILPAVAGEGVVIRILDRKNIILQLEDLGLTSDVKHKFKEAISQSNGMILVTGPTGSGKTTTLYAVLNVLNSPTKKLVTIEDPVEYHLHGVNQIQIQPNVGLTFATGLRAFFRHDPDIIMVGEIRDIETAQTAIEAALTGHLVLSTLHTTNAVGAVTRLMDMGVEPFLIASTLRCVLAQRLLRIICNKCKELIKPSNRMISILKELSLPVDNLQLFKGKGCNECDNTGYKGRIGIFELLFISKELQEKIEDRAPETQLLEIAEAQGLKPLMKAGMEKVIEGITTIEEVFRVI